MRNNLFYWQSLLVATLLFLVGGVSVHAVPWLPDIQQETNRSHIEVTSISQKVFTGQFAQMNTVSAQKTATMASGPVTIGTGTSFQRFPIGSLWGYERSAAIYTAAEIGTDGTIISVAWDASAIGTRVKPTKIYLKETTKTSFANAADAGTWADQIAGATLVYDANITNTATGWNTYNLTTTFNYSGVDNLLVLVEVNYGGGGGSDGATFRYSTKSNAHAYWTTDTNPPAGNANSANSNRPNIQIGFPFEDCSGTPDAGSAALSLTENSPNSSYTVSASGYEAADGLEYQWQSSINGGAWLNEGLASNTYADYNATAPGNIGDTVEWRLKVTCTNGGGFDYSTTATFEVCGCGIIGDGAMNTNGTGSDPVDDYFKNMRYQVVYTAAELSAMGMQAGNHLTALGWSVSESPGILGDYTIKIGHTSNANSSAHINSGDLTTVKNPFSYTPAVQAARSFDMLSFDANFVWNGTDNIVIDICTSNNPYASPYGGVRADSMPSGSRSVRSDTDNQCNTNTTTTNTNRPQVKFSFIQPVGCSGTPDGGSAALSSTEGGSASSYTVSASGYEVAADLEYQWQSSTNGGAWVDEGLASSIYADYNATAPANVGDTVDWRLKVSCTNGGGFDYSTTATFEVVETCTWTVHVWYSGWGDATTWTLKDAGGVTLLSGGTYNSNFNDTKTIEHPGPVTFSISNWGSYEDNHAEFTVSNDNGIIVSGQMGAAAQTFADLECSDLPLAQCSGEPEGGTAVATPATGPSGQLVTLTASDYSEGEIGLSYDWEYRFDEEAWTSTGVSANSVSYYISGVEGTVFEARYAVSCSNSGETGYSTSAIFTIGEGCTPVYASGCTSDDYIAEFTLSGENGTSISRTGGSCDGSYLDKKSESIELDILKPYQGHITAGTTGDRVTIWLIDDDWNSTLVTPTTAANNETGSDFNLEIPGSVVAGTYT
ncbi:MAG: hypothetical protein PHC38_05665, partial [Weeksellaceae bacterium]|nr:hypothetical protein [Weeksellaceae bacterium]